MATTSVSVTYAKHKEKKKNKEFIKTKKINKNTLQNCFHI